VRRRGAGAAAAAVALAFPAGAAAVPACSGNHPTRDIVTDGGLLESVVADSEGRLVYSEDDGLTRIDRPGQRPHNAARFAKPGGLLAEPDGTVIAGSGDGIQEGLQGNVNPIAKLVKVDTNNGKVTPYIDGLQMANGVARGADGTIYASNDIGLRGIDRIVNGKVELGWGGVFSANGMALDPFGPYLYAAQTFQPAAIARVDIRTGAVSNYVSLGLRDWAAGPDGMTIDQQGRLFVAANLAGQVWRVDRNRRVCYIARGLRNTSAVAFGSSLSDDGFPAENLYAVGFQGTVTEIPDARPRPATTVAAPRGETLVLRVSPRRVRAGRKVRLRIRVSFRSPTGERPAPRARVAIGGRVVRTDRRGRKTVARRFRKAGPVRVRVVTTRKPRPSLTLRVLPRR
jgi:sugar lactone lactonase YvrE